MNDIKSLIAYSEELLVAIKSKNKTKIEEALGKLLDFCGMLRRENKNYKPYLFFLAGQINIGIGDIYRNLDDLDHCKGTVESWLALLRSVKDQTKVLKEIIKNYIAPILKRMGFKRKGINFSIEKEKNGTILIVNIQSSSTNTFEEVQFTINLTVYRNKEEYERGVDVAQTRISHLKNKRDNWYLLTPNVNPNKLGEEVKSDIDRYVHSYFLYD